MKSQKLLSIGQIAAIAGVPPHRVLYYVKSRGIEPTARPGGYRVFDEDGVARILANLTPRPGSDRLGIGDMQSFGPLI